MNEKKPDGFWEMDGLAPGLGILTWGLYIICVTMGYAFFNLDVSRLMVLFYFLGGFIFSFAWMFIIAIINCINYVVYNSKYKKWKKKEDINTWIRSCRK